MIKVFYLLIFYHFFQFQNLIMELYAPNHGQKKRSDAFPFFFFFFLFFNEFKLGHNASQTLDKINRVWGEGSTCDWIVLVSEVL